MVSSSVGIAHQFTRYFPGILGVFFKIATSKRVRVEIFFIVFFRMFLLCKCYSTFINADLPDTLKRS